MEDLKTEMGAAKNQGGRGAQPPCVP